MSQAFNQTPRYKKLIADLKPLIQNTTQTGSQALNAISLDSYWQIGRKLKKEHDDTSIFISQVAKDTNVEPTFLYRTRKFHDTWPNGLTPQAKKLAWRKHTTLFGLAPKLRDFYVATALKKGWNTEELRRQLQNDYYTHANKFEDDKATPLLTRDPDPMYIYKAEVRKVIDGDTLRLRIDVGFHSELTLTVRLRGINTSEMDRKNKPSANGTRAERAKAYIQKIMASVPFVVVKTYQTDIYGRYIADVFYHPKLEDVRDVAMTGVYLNEELLRQGLADLMMV